MTTTSCPSCGHVWTPAVEPAPDPSVVHWFRTAQTWSGTMSTDEVYGRYLLATDDVPVSRRRFVSDLGYLGVEEVLDDEVPVLDRP